jgi:hypothetical protein
MIVCMESDPRKKLAGIVIAKMRRLINKVLVFTEKARHGCNNTDRIGAADGQDIGTAGIGHALGSGGAGG